MTSTLLSDLFGSTKTCYYCGRDFDNIQAVRAHLKHCEIRKEGKWQTKKRSFWSGWF